MINLNDATIQPVIETLLNDPNITFESMLTYSEGGNTLSGSLADGSLYVIIGHDTFAITKRILIEVLGPKKVTDDLIRKAFCVDYQVHIENLYFVEQPGDFHLDISMTIMGPKQVVVNDAESAWNIQYAKLCEKISKSSTQEEIDRLKQELRNLMTYKETANKTKMFEDLAATELTEKGFTVSRHPGIFIDPATKKQIMNFFNMVQANTKKGKKVFLALWCGDDYKEYFRNLVGAHDFQNYDIHYLSKDESQSLLNLYGGVSCSIKSVPSLQSLLLKN